MRSLARPAAKLLALVTVCGATGAVVAPAKAETSDKAGIVLKVPAIALGEIIEDNSRHSRVIVIETVAGDVEQSKSAGKNADEASGAAGGSQKSAGTTADAQKFEATVSTIQIVPNQGTLNRPGPVFCHLPRIWLAGIRQMNSFKTEIKLMPEDEEDTGAIRPSYATVAIEQWGR